MEQINIQGKGRTNQDKVSSTIFKRPIYGAYNITSPIRLRHESFWTRNLHSQSLLWGPPFCLKALILSNAGAPADPAHRTSKTGALFGFYSALCNMCSKTMGRASPHAHTHIYIRVQQGHSTVATQVAVNCRVYASTFTDIYIRIYLQRGSTEALNRGTFDMWIEYVRPSWQFLNLVPRGRFGHTWAWKLPVAATCLIARGVDPIFHHHSLISHHPLTWFVSLVHGSSTF